jgi:hypothetical protein
MLFTQFGFIFHFRSAHPDRLFQYPKDASTASRSGGLAGGGIVVFLRLLGHTDLFRSSLFRSLLTTFLVEPSRLRRPAQPGEKAS